MKVWERYIEIYEKSRSRKLVSINRLGKGTRKGTKQPLLLFLMEPFGDLLGDQGGVAAGSVVHDTRDFHLHLQPYPRNMTPDLAIFSGR